MWKTSFWLVMIRLIKISAWWCIDNLFCIQRIENIPFRGVFVDAFKIFVKKFAMVNIISMSLTMKFSVYLDFSESVFHNGFILGFFMCISCDLGLKNFDSTSIMCCLQAMRYFSNPAPKFLRPQPKEPWLSHLVMNIGQMNSFYLMSDLMSVPDSVQAHHTFYWWGKHLAPPPPPPPPPPTPPPPPPKTRDRLCL